MYDGYPTRPDATDYNRPQKGRRLPTNRKVLLLVTRHIAITFRTLRGAIPTSEGRGSELAMGLRPTHRDGSRIYQGDSFQMSCARLPTECIRSLASFDSLV